MWAVAAAKPGTTVSGSAALRACQRPRGQPWRAAL